MPPPTPPTTRALVLGAGPSGLAVSRQLSRSGKFPLGVVAVDASGRPGGWVASQRSEATGALLERGPHSLRGRTTGNGLAVVRLLGEDGVGLGERAIAASGEATARFVWTRDGRLVKLPASLAGLVAEPFTRRLPWEALREMVRARRANPLSASKDDESIRDFFATRLSERTADELVAAVVAGIFAGDTAQLSVASCFPEVVRRTREGGRGSLIRGMVFAKDTKTATPVETPLTTASSVSFSNGMQELTEALERAARQSGVVIKLNTPVSDNSLRRDAETGMWRLDALPGEEFSHVVSTLPIKALRRGLLSAGAALEPGVDALGRLEGLIGRVDVAVVNLVYGTERPAQAAFGHLVASATAQAETGALGVIYDSLTFPQQQPTTLLDANGSVLSVMLGGAHAPWIARESLEAVALRAASVVKTHLGFRTDPVETLASLHMDCIPQYRVGHGPAARAARRALLPANLLLLGTGVTGVGLADAIGGGMAEARRWLVFDVV